MPRKERRQSTAAQQKLYSPKYPAIKAANQGLWESQWDAPADKKQKKQISQSTASITQQAPTSRNNQWATKMTAHERPISAQEYSPRWLRSGWPWRNSSDWRPGWGPRAADPPATPARPPPPATRTLQYLKHREELLLIFTFNTGNICGCYVEIT